MAAQGLSSLGADRCSVPASCAPGPGHAVDAELCIRAVGTAPWLGSEAAVMLPGRGHMVAQAPLKRGSFGFCQIPPSGGMYFAERRAGPIVQRQQRHEPPLVSDASGELQSDQHAGRIRYKEFMPTNFLHNKFAT